MDGLRNPVGDQPPAVYWRRRLIVLATAVALVLVLWFLISATLAGGDDESAPATTTPPTAQAEAADPSDPSRPCTADDVTVSAAPSPENVSIGSMAAFEVALEHTGEFACSLSSNGDGTVLTVRSGDDVYYDSTWCTDAAVFEDADWVLQPGDKEALQAVWTGKRHSESCEPGDDAPAGTFRAAIAVAGIRADEAPFQMVN